MAAGDRAEAQVKDPEEVARWIAYRKILARERYRRLLALLSALTRFGKR